MMDKGTPDCSSDSDSSVSASWVFVPESDGVASTENNSNTFHLDCSREPIQELTEQDLHSGSSDIESDTDGISVISESEVPIEESIINADQPSTSCQDQDPDQDESQEVVTSTEITKQLVPQTTERPTRCISKFANIIGISLIVTAIFLASYLSTRDTDYFKEKDKVNNLNRPNLLFHNYKNDKIRDVKNELNDEIQQVVDITLSCSYGKKPRNYIKEKEIKLCVDKEFKAKRFNQNFASNDINKKYKQKVTKNTPKDRNYDYGNDAKLKKNKFDDEFKVRYCNNKKYVPKERPNCYKKGHDKQKEKYYNPKKYYQNYENPINLNDKNKKHFKMKENKNYTNKFNQFNKNKQNSTGEWYINLHKARNQLRKEEHVSDWIFERAYFRNRRRNKAQWYFKWMDIRAQLRHKQNYRPYSS